MSEKKITQKKTNLKYINLVNGNEKDYFKEKDCIIHDKVVKKIKIGLKHQDVYSLAQYQPSAEKMPKISNSFNSFQKIGSKIEEEAKARARSKSKIHQYKYRKYENQNKLSSRYHLVQRKKQTKVYKEEAYSNFKEIKEKHDFNVKKTSALLSLKGMSKTEISQIDRKAIERGYENAIDDSNKVQRYFQKLETRRNSKKLAIYCSKFHQKKISKNKRNAKEYTIRAKKLSKEALNFWRKKDKKLTELKKREKRLEKERKKKEEERKEAILQQKRLAFLMKQSDIYAHFMAKKLGIHSNSDEKKREENMKRLENEVENLDVEIDEEKALENVQNIINEQRRRKEMYDEGKMPKIHSQKRGAQKILIREKIPELIPEDEIGRDRITKEELKADYQPFDFSNVNLDDNSNLIQTANSFNGVLKEYQLKGLRWLDNLFEQGINGILADEMGLGKTIQAIALLTHLAEKKNNYGPFLVIAPNSTLYNWRNEINRFAPDLKIIPYWGNANHRKVIRKFFKQSDLGEKDSRMHITITSYNLAVLDFKSFHRVRWQYIILDEAQAIKNNNSQRWKTLLSFKSRNKLLLTGTPIQNSMTELWSLLHFIMPQLFDSLEQFKEWFSKDIEANSGDKQKINSIQLNRLHAILKPFMLRRVKKDVEKEMGKKTEVKILCSMTKRQRQFYASLKDKLSVGNFMEVIGNKKSLLNLVMQLRKVCNHPELFERRQFKTSYIFHNIKPKENNFLRDQGFNNIFYPNWCNPICLQIPTLVYHEAYGISKGVQRLDGIKKKFKIFEPDYIHKDIYCRENSLEKSCFSFLPLLNLKISDFCRIVKEDEILRYLALYHANRVYGRQKYLEFIHDLMQDGGFSLKKKRISLKIGNCFKYYGFRSSPHNILNPKNMGNLRRMVDFNIEGVKFYMPRVVTVPIEFHCDDTNFVNEHIYNLKNPLINYLFFGSNKYYPHQIWLKSSKVKEFMYSRVTRHQENRHYRGILRDTRENISSHITPPSFQTMVADSAKLRYLDKLLPRLKIEGHRALIFCQMTKMLNILEEYLLKKNYSYFRLDGSTDIRERDRMVQEYQVNPNIFCFILSTRAGGLGVTLTAADTVIFYDNDWNPTMDAQATDRAHRIGQTKDVTVYRLVTKHTIEERILKRAQQKKDVQQTVYSGEAFKADKFKPSEVMDLLFEEEEEEQKKLTNEANEQALKAGNSKSNNDEKEIEIKVD